MATSAFKSTTKRDSIGGSSSEDSTRRSIRRSRSLSRFSHQIVAEPDSEPDYNKNAPRGKFVNTSRGSTTPFPEISLDDLALEFFSSSSKNDTESDGGVVERKERVGRSVSRREEIGRWASDTASSRRRGRSVSRSRGDVVSNSSAVRTKNVSSSDATSRRRRSQSATRYRNGGSEYENEDNDKVVLASDSDLQEAIYNTRRAGWKLLRLHLEYLGKISQSRRVSNSRGSPKYARAYASSSGYSAIAVGTVLIAIAVGTIVISFYQIWIT